MRNIELSESDCIFIYYALRQYASTNESFDHDDKIGIYELANNFK